MIYTVRPIGGIWPGRRTLAANRKRSPFKAIYTRIISDLARELKFLRAREVVFRLEVSEYGIRQDGQLRSDARISDPGIIVEFNADKIAGSPRLRYKCDRYKTLRAALHRTHPDRNEGERLVYDQVDAARRVLSAHHGISL